MTLMFACSNWVSIQQIILITDTTQPKKMGQLIKDGREYKMATNIAQNNKL